MLQLTIIMKLFFDARYIRTDRHDGISRYSMELAHATYKNASKKIKLTFLICDKKQVEFLPEGASTILIHPPTSPKEVVSALIINRLNPDVVFSPMQTLGLVGRKFKAILTLHDLIYYRHRKPPTALNLAIKLLWRIYHLSYIPQRITLNSADLVATVSETSKKDIKAVNLTKNEVLVVPNAPQRLARYLKAEPSISEDGAKNLIYMGSFMKYKNVETLVRSMEWMPDHTLHLLSRITPERRAEYEAITPAGAKIVYHNGVSDAQYAKLLSKNALLVTASFDEGYGLPLAEALELGVPVVVSDLEIFHEVAGPGGSYAKVDSPKDFAYKILEASEPDNYKKLSKAGKKHISQYSWDKSAKTLLKAVESLI